MAKEYYFFDLKNKRKFMLATYCFSQQDLEKLKAQRELFEFYFVLLQLRKANRGFPFDVGCLKSITPSLFLFFERAQNKVEFRNASQKYDDEYENGNDITFIFDSVDPGIQSSYQETEKIILNYYFSLFEDFNLERYAWKEYCFCFMNGCHEDACPGLGSCSMADERIKSAVEKLIFCGVKYSSVPHVQDHNFKYLNGRCFQQYKSD